MSRVHTTQVRFLSFTDAKLYVVSVAFVTANVLAPAVLHQFGQAGQIFLPLYFFSLVGGLWYGWRVGLVTGLVSPIVSFYLTSMPPVPILPFVILKSVLLGASSGTLVERFPTPHLAIISSAAVIITQLLGVLIILASTHNVQMALADLNLGYPGLTLQIAAAPLLVSSIARNATKVASGDSHKDS